MCCFIKNTAEIKESIQQSLPDDENISIFIDNIEADHRSAVVAVSEKHLAICYKGLFRKKYAFHQLSGIKEVSLEELILTSRLDFIFADNRNLGLAKLSKSDARLLNGIIRKAILKSDAKKMIMGIPCPFCSEIIKTTAIICPHCHKDLPGKK